MRSAKQLHPVALLAALLLSVPGCGGGSSSENSGPPPAADTTPPFTLAQPPGGLYPAIQLVTLNSNESAVIHYTTDGSAPVPGVGTTISGSNPITGILINRKLTLNYYGVDDAGNVEAVKTDEYDLDTNPPNIFLGTYTSPIAMLEIGELNFQSDEDGTYRVEAGGTGEPQTGALVASGLVQAGFITTVDVIGWELEPGVTNTLWIYAFDGAGGYGSLDVDVDSAPPDDFSIPGESGDLVTTGDGRFLFVTRPDENAVWRYDADALSSDYHQLKEEIPVGSNPSSLAMTSDESYLYVTCDGQVEEIDLDNGVVTTIPIPNGSTPSGIALMPKPTLAYVACTDHLIRRIDIERGSATLHEVLAVPTSHHYQTLMNEGRLAINSLGNRLVMVWTGDSTYGAIVLDVDPASTYYHQIRGTLIPAVSKPATIGIPAINSDGTLAYLGSATGRLATASLLTLPAQMVDENTSISVRAITPSLDGQFLLLHGGSLSGIRLVNPDTLGLINLVPSGGSEGTGDSLCFSADGKRAYLVRENDSTEATMWVPVLYQ